MVPAPKAWPEQVLEGLRAVEQHDMYALRHAGPGGLAHGAGAVYHPLVAPLTTAVGEAWVGRIQVYEHLYTANA